MEAEKDVCVVTQSTPRSIPEDRRSDYLVDLSCEPILHDALGLIPSATKT